MLFFFKIGRIRAQVNSYEAKMGVTWCCYVDFSDLHFWAGVLSPCSLERNHVWLTIHHLICFGNPIHRGHLILFVGMELFGVNSVIGKCEWILKGNKNHSFTSTNNFKDYINLFFNII